MPESEPTRMTTKDPPLKKLIIISNHQRPIPLIRNRDNLPPVRRNMSKPLPDMRATMLGIPKKLPSPRSSDTKALIRINSKLTVMLP